MCASDVERQVVEVFDAARVDQRRLANGDDESQGARFVLARNAEADDMLRERYQRQLGLHDDAERAFAADEPIDRVLRERIARRVLVESGPPDVDRFTAGSNDRERAHVRARRTVEQRSRSGRVARDRTANGYVVLARGIGRELQSVLADRALQVAQENSGLDDRAALGDVDVDDAIHRAHREQHAAIGDGRAGGARLSAGRCD